MERLYAIAVGKDYLDPHTRHGEVTAERLTEALRKFHVIDMAQSEYAALGSREKAAIKKESGFIIGGNFGGGKKSADCVSRSLVTLDLDAITPETAKQSIETLQFLGHKAVIYSTASHRPDSPRLRAFVFLASDAKPEDYRTLVTYFANLLPPGAVSSETYKVGQLMYKPARCRDGEEVFIEIAGTPMDPAAAIATVPPEVAGDRPSQLTKAWEKPGIVGAVARLFEGDFDKAIMELGLPYQRSTAGATCGVGEDRYTYTKGAGADGAVWYSGDGHLWSHHGTDPCREQNCTIFDVVRLHEFKPESDDETLPIQERTSHAAARSFFLTRYPALRAETSPKATIAELDDLGPPEPPRAADPGRFTVVSAVKFALGKVLSWWVKWLVPQAELGVIYGESGSGKSFLTLDIVAAIQRGVSWRGYKVRQGNAVIVTAEGAAGARQRFLAYSKEHNVPLEKMPAVIPDAPNLLVAEDVQDLIAALKAHGKVDVLVIDTLSATTPGGNENSGEDMGRALGHCKAISRTTGAFVLLVHHSGKNKAMGARGWSGLKAATDMELEVVREGDDRLATLSKSKDGRDGLQFGFRLKVIVLGVDSDGDEISSCTVEAVEIEKTEGKIESSLKGLRRGQVQSWKLIEEAMRGGLTGYDDVRERLINSWPDTGTLAARRRKGDRMLQVFLDRGMVHAQGKKLSLTAAVRVDAAELGDDE